MLLKKNSEISHIHGNEGAKIKQYFHPDNTSEKIKYSLAQFTLEPKRKTKLHKLESSEIYYILEGEATLEINGNKHTIKKDDSILVFPESEQYIKNTGSSILRFLCIVEPAWEQSSETIFRITKRYARNIRKLFLKYDKRIANSEYLSGT